MSTLISALIVTVLFVLAVQKVLSGSGRAGRLRLIGKYSGHRLVVLLELDNTFWIDSTYSGASVALLPKRLKRRAAVVATAVRSQASSLSLFLARRLARSNFFSSAVLYHFFLRKYIFFQNCYFLFFSPENH